MTETTNVMIVNELHDSLFIDKSLEKFPSLFQRKRYLLKSSLSQTSYGFTLHCWDVVEHQDVCVKICISSACDQFEQVQMLCQSISSIKNETECLQYLHPFAHPHLIQYVESFQDNSFHYLVTKLVHGVEMICYSALMVENDDTSTFPDMIQSKSMVMKEYQFFSQQSNGYSPEQIQQLDRYLFQQLVHTVYFLHQKGVAHGDLAWENVMVSRNFHITIIDFGTAIRQKVEEKEQEAAAAAEPRPFWVRFCPETSTNTFVNRNYMTMIDKIWDENVEDFVTTVDNDGVPFGHDDTSSPEILKHNMQIVDLFAVDRYALGAILFLLSGNTSSDKKLTKYFKTIYNHDWNNIDSHWEQEEAWKTYSQKAPINQMVMEVINGLIKPPATRWDWSKLLNHPYVKDTIHADRLPQPHMLRRITRSMAQFFSI